jgi:hypothetical protein
MRESEIQKQIMLALGCRPDLRLWRRNVGTARDPVTGRVVRFGVPGEADLQGILAPSGRFFGIEVKSKAGQLSAEQRAWGEMIQRMGGVYCVARSVSDATKVFDNVQHP